ncbi:hypothetical protein C5167_046261 [Papaver somniferum]|uniref:Uncharacterized protein n=1 Tax=Papaver somniferum TaxID=3469 RepID=A0A4Y7LH41_PAPSO|nr:hypothetical protein C5167_046261 [Papaver somniferum]
MLSLAALAEWYGFTSHRSAASFSHTEKAETEKFYSHRGKVRGFTSPSSLRIVIGSAVGGTASAFYGFNLVTPLVQRRIKGPMWLHFLVGTPPVILFSSACAGLAGGAVPAVAQLVSSSYHAASSSLSASRPVSSEDDKKIPNKSTTSTV